MEVVYQCGLQDYLEAQYAHTRRSIAFYVVSAVIIGSMGIFGIYQLMSEGYPNGYSPLAIVIMWALLRFVFRPLYFRRDFRKHPNFAMVQTLHIDENGLEYKHDLGHSVTKWAAFTKFREAPNLFLLYVGPRLFHVIPKRCFHGPQLDEFHALLFQKLSAK
jgi:YcxB-like protein